MYDISQAQWFVIRVIGGKEESIKLAIEEKVHNYGYEQMVGQIRIFKTTKIIEEIFEKESNEIPSSPKNTKTTTWTVLADGRYKKTRARVVNKFPGYLFINMVYDRDVWYAIRNAQGVLGFVGSSGKGATPIPITIEEYNNIDNIDGAERAVINEVTEQAIEHKTAASIVEETKVVHVTNAKIGNNVEIVDGPFNGMMGEVKRLDNINGIAVVSVDMFGRSQDVDIKYEQFKLAV